ncbi:Probable transmembrane protein [Richelia intracellularis]|nr:Probable transmembrane protein [Richelia intracellularis]
MTEFNWITALGGAVLIGISATLLLPCNERIAGISGIVNGTIAFSKNEVWRWLFIIGMLLGGLVNESLLPSLPTPTSVFSRLEMILAGFLVSFGTPMGSGSASGHGVCGLGRLSPRSLVAVITFLFTGMLTIIVSRYLLPFG